MSKLSKAKFCSFLNIEMGQSPEGSCVNNLSNGIPLLNGPAEFTDFYPIPVQYTTNGKRFSEKSDILFCVRGSTTGRMNISDRRYAIGRGLASISHKQGKEFNPFVKALITINLKGLLGGTLGSVFPNLTKEQLFDFECIIPDLPTQQKIATVLSSLDAKIELNNRINAELEQMAKTLYDYWFVQFDFPNSQGKPYKSSGGKMVWCPELKREVPEGWEVKGLGEIADCNKWTINSKSKVERVNYLDTSNLTRNVIENIIPINISCDTLPSRAQRIIAANDILFSTVRPNQCHYGIIKEPILNLIASSGFAHLRSKNESISNDLIYFYLTSSRTIERLQQIAETSVSAYPSVSPNDILELKVCLPTDKQLLDQINQILNSINSKISNLLKENQHLSSLRDWLLPMLMNGQVKVGETKGYTIGNERLGMVAEP